MKTSQLLWYLAGRGREGPPRGTHTHTHTHAHTSTQSRAHIRRKEREREGLFPLVSRKTEETKKERNSIEQIAGREGCTRTSWREEGNEAKRKPRRRLKDSKKRRKTKRKGETEKEKEDNIRRGIQN